MPLKNGAHQGSIKTKYDGDLEHLQNSLIDDVLTMIDHAPQSAEDGDRKLALKHMTRGLQNSLTTFFLTPVPLNGATEEEAKGDSLTAEQARKTWC